MLTNSLPTNVVSGFGRSGLRSPQATVLVSIGGRSGVNLSNQWLKRQASDESDATVEVTPADGVKRRPAAWGGMAAEIVQATHRDRFETRYLGARHLLILHEQGTRRDGETSVEGLPRSTLRDCRRKMTFVPAGHDYREWQVPNQPGRVTYFYFDPSLVSGTLDQGAETALAPKLLFEDAALWETALKLSAQIERAGSDDRTYLEALGVVLAHELARFVRGVSRAAAPTRGGLAPWQQRIVTSYIEEHLAEPIPLSTLAGLVNLSTYYFCRAFKQSFGVPPHRFHTNCRIERAKALLANTAPSVTDIGLELGFSETSSFSVAFRKVTGLTPTAYHRSLR